MLDDLIECGIQLLNEKKKDINDNDCSVWNKYVCAVLEHHDYWHFLLSYHRLQVKVLCLEPPKRLIASIGYLMDCSNMMKG